MRKSIKELAQDAWNAWDKTRKLIVSGTAWLLRVDIKQYADPVERIFELEDTPETMYVWKFDEDKVSDKQIVELKAEAETRFIKNNHRDPYSPHFFLTEIDEVEELTKREVKDRLGSWLKG